MAEPAGLNIGELPENSHTRRSPSLPAQDAPGRAIRAAAVSLHPYRAHAALCIVVDCHGDRVAEPSGLLHARLWDCWDHCR